MKAWEVGTLVRIAPGRGATEKVKRLARKGGRIALDQGKSWVVVSVNGADVAVPRAYVKEVEQW